MVSAFQKQYAPAVTARRKSSYRQAHPATGKSFQPGIARDFFCASVPAFGLFAHVENQESLVSFPKGDPIYATKGHASIEVCQAGFQANLLGTAAVAGAGMFSALGLAGLALPLCGAGVAALAISGTINAWARREIESADL